MRILAIDVEPVLDDDIDLVEFGSNRAMLDYDAVVWDPAHALDRFLPHATRYKNLPSLTESASADYLRTADRYTRELQDMMSLGRVLIVLLGGDPRAFVDTGRRETSGTGRNQKVTRLVSEVRVLDVLPTGVATTEAVGSNITLVADGPVRRFLAKHADIAGYQMYLNEDVGTTVATVSGTDRPTCAVVNFKGGGRMVLLPAIDPYTRLSDEDFDEDEWGEGGVSEFARMFLTEFWDSVRDLIRDLLGGAEATQPVWTGEYLVRGEREALADVARAQVELEASRARLDEAARDHASIERRKTLFTGTGTPLVAIVGEVLVALGGQLSDPEPGRDDLIVVFPETTAVVEVKGVSKSAAEKHAAQLEKWVSEHTIAHGTTPKGILVVNAYRDEPLRSRQPVAFPNQMIDYSSRRGHCLISGIQLLGVWDALLDDPSRAAELRAALLGTEGVFGEFDEWSEFLTVEPAPAEDEEDV